MLSLLLVLSGLGRLTSTGLCKWGGGHGRRARPALGHQGCLGGDLLPTAPESAPWRILSCKSRLLQSGWQCVPVAVCMWQCVNDSVCVWRCVHVCAQFLPARDKCVPVSVCSVQVYLWLHVPVAECGCALCVVWQCTWWCVCVWLCMHVGQCMYVWQHVLVTEYMCVMERVCLWQWVSSRVWIFDSTHCPVCVSDRAHVHVWDRVWVCLWQCVTKNTCVWNRWCVLCVCMPVSPAKSVPLSIRKC
jgi:hypothetical protein